MKVNGSKRHLSRLENMRFSTPIIIVRDQSIETPIKEKKDIKLKNIFQLIFAISDYYICLKTAAKCKDYFLFRILLINSYQSILWKKEFDIHFLNSNDFSATAFMDLSLNTGKILMIVWH